MKMNKKTNKGSLRTFFKVMKYLKLYKIHFLLSLIFTAASVLLTMYVPILVGETIDLAIGENNVDLAGIAKILQKIMIVVAATGVLQWLINLLNNRMTYGIVKNIRNEAFKKIQALPISYIDSHRSGDIVSRIITDADQFSDGLLMGFTQFFNGILTILVTIVFMLTISKPITLIVVLVTPLSLFVAADNLHNNTTAKILTGLYNPNNPCRSN